MSDRQKGGVWGHCVKTSMTVFGTLQRLSNVDLGGHHRGSVTGRHRCVRLCPQSSANGK